MTIKSYRDLTVWQRAVQLVEATYRVSRCLPPDERFGLTSQMQRAAISIPANIAEGYGRARRKDYMRYLSIAMGSLMELETHFTIAQRLGFFNADQVAPSWELAQEVGRMLNSLIVRLRSSEKSL